MNRTTRILVPAVLLLLAGSALAQPGGAPQPPPPPPPGTYQPAPAPAPPPPGPYQPPPPAGYAPPPPQPYYQQQPPPYSMGPDRRGFTIGLDIGFGLTNISADGGGDTTEAGLSGLNLTLGGFINPKLAVAFRVSQTLFQYDLGFGDSIWFQNGFVGGIVQAWVAPQFFVGGGAGVGVFQAPFEEGSSSETGLALQGRVGYEFSQSRTSGFHAALEISPAFYDGARVTSVGLQIGWQSY